MSKSYNCGNCGGLGHNRATCTNPTKPKPAPKPAPKPKDRRELLEARYPGVVEKLKNFTNSHLAVEYNVSREYMRQLRALFDIPKIEPKVLPPDGIEMLGKVPDTHIAEFFDVSSSYVQLERAKRNIPPASPNDYYDRIIGLMRDRVGVDTDPVLAKKLNLPTSAIFKYRMRNNIPPARLSPMCKDFKPIDRDLVATLFRQGASDEEIARAAKSTPGSVANIRCRMHLHRVPEAKD